MNHELRIENLTQVYPGGAKALDALNLTLRTGVFGLLGPNGAGKTTLMEILALRRMPTSGGVSLDGVDWLAKPSVSRGMLGYLPQFFDFYAMLKVRESLLLLARLFGYSAAEARQRTEAAIEWAHLGRLGQRQIKALSGGERRRFGIAQAILNDPRVLIVDEPTVGLDAQERLTFQNLLFRLGRERVVLLSTHLVGDIEATCRDIAVLGKGKLLFQGEIGELIRRAKGKSWIFETDGETVDRLAARGSLVTARETGSGFIVRAVSDEKPNDYARPAEPGLEDAYIRLVGNEGRAIYEDAA